MKMRHGWVSNSSTSSFVGVLGKVKNRAAAEKFIKNNSKYGFKVYTVKELESEIEKRPFWLAFAGLDSPKIFSVRPSKAWLEHKDKRAHYITLDYRIDEHDLPIKVQDESGDVLLDKSYDESNKDILELVNDMKNDAAFDDVKSVYYWDRW